MRNDCTSKVRAFIYILDFPHLHYIYLGLLCQVISPHLLILSLDQLYLFEFDGDSCSVFVLLC